MSKRSLQIATAILGAVPVLTGIIGMLGVYDPLYAPLNLPPSALLDSNLRFFSGVWLGLGIAVWRLIPSIDQRTPMFSTLWGFIFIGGIGRLLSMLVVGMPPLPFVAFTALETFGRAALYHLAGAVVSTMIKPAANTRARRKQSQRVGDVTARFWDCDQGNPCSRPSTSPPSTGKLSPRSNPNKPISTRRAWPPAIASAMCAPGAC